MRAGRNRLTISIALVASFVLSSVTLTAAQETREAKATKETKATNATASANDWSRLKTVTSGSRLAVKLSTGKTLEGKLNSVSDAELLLSVKDKPVSVKRADILGVYQINKKSATKATLVGLGLGAGAGAAIGLAGSNDDSFAKLDHAVTAGLARAWRRSRSTGWVSHWPEWKQASADLSSKPTVEPCSTSHWWVWPPRHLAPFCFFL